MVGLARPVLLRVLDHEQGRSDAFARIRQRVVDVNGVTGGLAMMDLLFDAAGVDQYLPAIHCEMFPGTVLVRLRRKHATGCDGQTVPLQSARQLDWSQDPQFALSVRATDDGRRVSGDDGDGGRAYLRGGVR